MQKKGFGSPTAALGHFCVHFLFAGLSAPPPPTTGTLLGLSRDPARRKGHHAVNQTSGLTSCSARTVRTAPEWASEGSSENAGQAGHGTFSAPRASRELKTEKRRQHTAEAE